MLFCQLIIIINIHPDFENLKHMKCSGKKTQASTWKEKFYKELKRFWAYFINSSIFLSGSKHLPHDNKMEDIFERDQFNVPNYIIIQKKNPLKVLETVIRKIRDAYILLAATEADKLKIGREPIMKRSSCTGRPFFHKTTVTMLI